jgi:hypothetical protein
MLRRNAMVHYLLQNSRQIALFNKIKKELQELDGKVSDQRERINEQEEKLKQSLTILEQVEALKQRAISEQHREGAVLDPTGEGGAPLPAVEELRERVRELTFNMTHRDESLRHLKEANAALIDQVKGRWTFVQALVSIVGFLFVINFGYQVYKTEDVKNVGQEARNALTKLEDQRRNINRQADQQARILAGMAEGVVLLNAGYKDVNNKRFSAAARRAELATEKVKTLLDQIPSSSPEVQLTSKSADAGNDKDSEEKIDLITPLSAAIKQLLMATYDLQAYCYFGLANQALDQYNRPPGYKFHLRRMDAIADKMIELASDRWEGHHWRGLYLTETISPRKPGSEGFKERFSQAERELNQAIRLDGDVKIDLINLAELAFVCENFRLAEKEAQAYLDHDPQPSLEVLVVCTFLAEMSRCLTNTKGSEGKRDAKEREKVQALLDDPHFDKFGEKYSFAQLKDFKDKIRTGKDETARLKSFNDSTREFVKQSIERLMEKARASRSERGENTASSTPKGDEPPPDKASPAPLQKPAA